MNSTALRALLTSLFLASACDNPRPQLTSSSTAACGAEAAPAAARFELTWSTDSTAEFGDVAGVAVTEEALYVLDTGFAQVVKLGLDGTVLSKFGRPGDGPGELQQFMLGRRLTHWAFSDGDGLLAFDGQRLHRFEFDGDFISGVQLEGATPFIPRIDAHAEDVVFGTGHTYPFPEPSSADAPYFFIRTVDNPAPLVGVAQHAMPVVDGRRLMSPLHPRPAWDADDGCVVLHDGSSNFIVVWDGARTDTIDVAVPEWATLRLDESSPLLQQMGMRRWPEPPAPYTIRDVVLEGPNVVWLMPAAENERRALRVSLQDGSAAVVMLSAFPHEFLPDGSYIAVLADSLGVEQVARFEPRPDPLQLENQ